MSTDVELVLTAWIRTTFDVRTCTELPADLAEVLPVVQVAALGGAGERFSTSPRVDVDVYAASYTEARTLCITLREALALLTGPVGDAVIRWIRVDAEPHVRPYGNSGLRRVGASFTVGARPNLYG